MSFLPIGYFAIPYIRNHFGQEFETKDTMGPSIVIQKVVPTLVWFLNNTEFTKFPGLVKFFKKLTSFPQNFGKFILTY